MRVPEVQRPRAPKRVDFLHFLDAQDLDLDVYGHPEHGFHRYRGPTPQSDKSSCLLPYRYYFDAENNAIPNFFTEKIVDCLLAETLCFYWGCPNLDSYFDPRAFIQLELDDFDADLARIREAIATDEWTRRLPYIRAEKRRILEDYGFFATLARAIDPVRRARRWNIDTTDRALVDEWIGTAAAVASSSSPTGGDLPRSARPSMPSAGSTGAGSASSRLPNESRPVGPHATPSSRGTMAGRFTRSSSTMGSPRTRLTG